MVSLSIRLTTAATRLALATVALRLAIEAPAWAAENADPETTTAAQIAAQIADEQAENGPYSLELLGLLRTLSILHEEHGEYAMSAAMLERAMQVVRANHGLRSFEQAALIEQRIAQEDARGNHAAAWDLEQSLLALVAANPDDLRAVPVLRGVAAKRMDAVARYAAGEFPPEILLGCYYNPSRNPDFGSCTSGSKGTALRALAADGRRHYRAAIDVLVRHDLSSGAEVRDLEMQIVRDSYRYGGYWPGREALRRMLVNAERSSAPWLTAADAALQIGDWDLAFGGHPNALNIYEVIYAALIERGAARSVIEERFGSRVPVRVPTFEPNPFDASQAAADAGYIDVAFEITKYGRGRRARILGATANTTEADREALIGLIARSRFRPRIADGQFVDTEIVTRRYLNAATPDDRHVESILSTRP
jgi:hypothetical protein